MNFLVQEARHFKRTAVLQAYLQLDVLGLQYTSVNFGTKKSGAHSIAEPDKTDIARNADDRHRNTHSRDLSGRGTARAEDAQGTPTQSHISSNILVYEDNNFRG